MAKMPTPEVTAVRDSADMYITSIRFTSAQLDCLQRTGILSLPLPIPPQMDRYANEPEKDDTTFKQITFRFQNGEVVTDQIQDCLDLAASQKQPESFMNPDILKLKGKRRGP